MREKGLTHMPSIPPLRPSMKHALYNVIAAPLTWPFYVAWPLAAFIADFFTFGVPPSAAGLVRGLLLLGVVCLGRRLLVGHWR
jgi:hypothetical protein